MLSLWPNINEGHIHGIISYHLLDLEYTLKFGRGIGILWTCLIDNALERDLSSGFLLLYTRKLHYLQLRQLGWIITHTNSTDIQVEFTHCQTKCSQTSRCVSCIFELPCFCHDFFFSHGQKLKSFELIYSKSKVIVISVSQFSHPQKTKTNSFYPWGL